MPWHDVALNALADASRKDQFIATLGHELRNPLAVITSAVEAMEYIAPGAEGFDELRESMARQCGHLTKIINDLLDISGFTNHKLILTPQTITLAEAVRQGIEMATPRVKERGHTVVTELDNEVKVYGDMTRLAQVVSNLITNAAKFTLTPSEIHVAVCVEGDNAVLKVRDRGIGIGQEMIDQVFQAFVQAKHGGTIGGLGLGLTLAQQIVHAHAGTIEVHSKGLGHGSEFVVRLHVSSRETAEQNPRVKPSNKQYRILIVDDTLEVLQGTATLLRLRNHETYTASNGSEAVRQFVKYRPDIVLLDLKMPDINGLELARDFRQISSNVTLVAVTGMSSDDDQQKAKEAGCNFFLVKPVMLKSLEEVFRSREIY